MIRINQIKLPHDGREYELNELKEILKKRVGKILRVDVKDISEIEIIRHSIDARKKPDIYHIYMVDVCLGGISGHNQEGNVFSGKVFNEEKIVNKCRDKNVSVVDAQRYSFEEQVKKLSNRECDIDKNKKIIIVGAGPAGLFCGYELAKNGYKPIILERGADVDERTRIVEHFWKTGELDVRTNVQFGEGGAGTFSDGKLNTMVKDKDGRGREALRIFVENGANPDIMYESKPHIGTDILRNVVRNIRNEIIAAGGEVRFGCQVTDIVVDDAGRITSVKYRDLSEEKISSSDEEKNSQSDSDKEFILDCDAVVLAIGHSARDTFYMLRDRKVDMAPKPFAVGFRVEHPQELINLSQYGVENPKGLPPSPYKLTVTTDAGRGVYSFCMCPGGFVVNASSEEGMLAVNGMSYSRRDGKNANSAIIITVDPSDFGGDDVLSGVEFQRRLEKKAFELGQGKIPVEYYGDFKKAVCDGADSIKNVNSGAKSSDDSELVKNLNKKMNTPNMCGEYVFADVHKILPDDLNRSFVEGMEKFGRIIRGYNSDGAIVSGVESRTSSPVRINRGETCESVNVHGLYPCGEGAGYAGGIMSAAMDGMKVAEFVAAKA